MVDVLLIQPKIGIDTEVSLPLSLLSVASVLRTYFSVQIIDTRIDPNWEETVEAALQTKPICVGTSCTIGPSIASAKQISAFIKKRSPIPFVLGGIFPSVLPELVLSQDMADIVVIDEGEETFIELVRHLAKKKNDLSMIRGIAYLDASAGFRKTKPRLPLDLASLPPLSFDLLDMEKYEIVYFEASRGCPYACSYCYNTAAYKKAWRCFSLETVQKNLDALINTYGFRKIIFSDDEFSLDLERMEKIAKMILDFEMQIEWGLWGMRIQDIERAHPSLLSLLEKSGLTHFHLGLETGSDRMQIFIKKYQQREMVLHANRKMAAYAFHPLYNVMTGFPSETLHDLRETTRLLSRLIQENPFADISSCNRFHPLPSTELYAYCKEKFGFVPPQTLDGWSNYMEITSFPWITKRRERLLECIDASITDVHKLHQKHDFISPWQKKKKLQQLYNFSFG